MSTTIKISNWQIVDIANQPEACPDGGLRYSPERCWFAVLNCDISPSEIILLHDELDIALRPLDQMEEMGFSAAMGISPSRDPLRRRLAGWFHVFRDPSVSMGQIVNGEPVAIGQLHQLACDMHDGGLIRFVDKTEATQELTTQQKSITTTDAWRVISQFRCRPISDNTRHFLSLVLRAIDRWQAVATETPNLSCSLGSSLQANETSQLDLRTVSMPGEGPRETPIISCGYLSSADLIKKYNIPESRSAAFEKRLRRWRCINLLNAGWIKHDAPVKNKPSYFYDERLLQEIISKYLGSPCDPSMSDKCPTRMSDRQV